MKQLRTFGGSALAALLCLSLAVWSVAPSASHIPSVVQVVADHADMIAEHGHSHGLEEDLYWAIHGHSHEVADHDHSQALLAFAAGPRPSFGYRDDFRLRSSTGGPHRVYLIERPPQA
ncbi:MAG: hypothetical protein P3W94_010725 [Paracoccus sp. (in: a-proteobacteria)]|nr:hypothetical protein [Paracoccus sp. (in: a-proteobacteria)]